jgi:hypothetical protein
LVNGHWRSIFWLLIKYFNRNLYIEQQIISNISMKIKNTLKITILTVAILCFGGCDQLRQKIADTLAPPSAAEVAVRINDLVEKDEPAKGIELGENYLKNTDGPAPAVHESLVNAYLAMNDATGALKHVQETSAEKNKPKSATSSRQVKSKIESRVAVDDASVTETDKGTVVRAGDAVVIMPK